MRSFLSGSLSQAADDFDLVRQKASVTSVTPRSTPPWSPAIEVQGSLDPNRNGLQPNSDGLQRTSDGLHPNRNGQCKKEQETFESTSDFEQLTFGVLVGSN